MKQHSELDIDVRETAVSDVPVESSAADVPAPGTVIDERYEVGALLGQGGMGYVVAARHVVLGTRLAMKVLRREMTRDAEMVERFRREARAASAIGHPGIVVVRDFGTLPSGACYFVMEHLDGKSLERALSEDGPFSVERAVDVVRQMAEALGAAHAAGIVHRDVKPDNAVLVTHHGRVDHVKLLDFGIAKLDFASRLSGAHRILGTPAYMAPEQARGGKVDHRTDVYALGVVLFELLTGTIPFEHAQPFEVLRMHMNTPAPSVLSRRPDLPASVADAVARCLAKDPAERPQSMEALIALLAPIAAPRRSEPALTRPSVERAPSRLTPSDAQIEAIRAVSALPVSRPSPLPAVPVTAAPSASRGVWIAGISLGVVGFALLAGALGVVIASRSSAAPVAAVMTPPPVLAAPPASVVAAPAPPAEAPAAPTAPAIVAAPSPAHAPAHPMPHATHPHPAPVTSTPTVSAPPPAAPPRDEHPAIRVIDPWS
jgi:serine/threonine-protein kinase